MDTVKKDISEVLEKLADKLGVKAEELFDAVKKQAKISVIESYVYIFMYIRRNYFGHEIIRFSFLQVSRRHSKPVCSEVLINR